MASHSCSTGNQGWVKHAQLVGLLISHGIYLPNVCGKSNRFTECIAEFTHSPLMVLTSSDIGTDPRTVEINLTREFKKAKSWGAVLLIDEADVFMERRSTRDLVRNSLVAGMIDTPNRSSRGDGY